MIAILYENSIKEIENSIKEIQYEMESTQKDINSAQIKVRNYLEEYLSHTGFKTPDYKLLDSIKNDADDKIKQLNELKEKAIFLEIALDSAEKSAKIFELENLFKGI